MIIDLNEFKADKELIKAFNEAAKNPVNSMTLGELAERMKAEGKVIKGTVKLT